MMLPIYVIAHAEANGHCGAKTTIAVVNDVFTWPYVKSDVAAFVSSCIHCLSSSSYRIPWHYGPKLQATAPNNVLLFDFLNLPPSAHGDTYILVLKDGMSNYVGLVVCTEPTAEVKQSALNKAPFLIGLTFRFGSHFKNTITSRLENVFGAQHHFVTAYCPWTNGSVEVVKRLVLHAIKTLLSEYTLPITKWTSILPPVQHSINAMPSDRIGGIAPLTAFAGLTGTSQLRAIIARSSLITIDEPTLQAYQQKTLHATRKDLDNIH
ncbi:hypothetical protein PHMEG_00025414 [Phytophthora megakarya]|uniref:Integrase catalytic domain-containing protein n=1 Tax=Phytophthora megakarya TaxID=4795 RepID=A0A225VDB3_9STRA|nr:hypothetical protein PHMEG_00025414 [Phytophthora megakarya]